MTTPILEFGIRIYIDGQTRTEVPLVPAHPDDPDPPRGFSHTSTPQSIRIDWLSPVNWGDESRPTGVPRFYEIEYRRDTNPDVQTDETGQTNITIRAEGGASLEHFRIRAVNAAGRKSHWVALPALPFEHYTRRFTHQFARQFA